MPSYVYSCILSVSRHIGMESWQGWPGEHTLNLERRIMLTNSMEQNPSEANSHSASQKFLASYGTWRFITMFTRAHHLSLSWARWIQSTTSHTISLRSILILSSDPCLGFLSCSSLYIFQPKYCMHFSSLSHAHYMPCSFHPPWLDHPDNVLWSVQVMKLLVMLSPAAFHHFLPLSSSPISSEEFCSHTWLSSWIWGEPRT